MKKILIVLVALSFIGISRMNAQPVRFGVLGGLTMVQSPDLFDELDMSTGYNLGAKIKISVPMSPLKITGQVVYNTFSGSPYVDVDYSRTEKIDVSTSLLILGTGFELNIVSGPVSPYLGADIFMASPGDLKMEYMGESEKVDGGDSCFGLGLGGGLEFVLTPEINMDIAAKYNMYELFSSDDGQEDMNAIALSVNFLLTLH